MPVNRNRRNGVVQVPLRFCSHLLVILLIALPLSVLISPATAEGDFVIVNAKNPAHAYLLPNPTSGILRYLSNGTPVHAICEDHGKLTTFNGVTSDIWVVIRNADGNGLDSWVSAWYVSVSNHTAIGPELQQCGAPSSLLTSAFPPMPGALQSLSRAMAQVGQTNSPLWPYWYWGGHCDNFVAYVNGLAHSGYANATDHWNDLASRGLAHPPDALPPWASLVFFDYWEGGRNLGHVAYSLGDGRLITTPALAGQAVRIYTIDQFKRFLVYKGWTPPVFKT